MRKTIVPLALCALILAASGPVLAQAPYSTRSVPGKNWRPPAPPPVTPVPPASPVSPAQPSAPSAPARPEVSTPPTGASVRGTYNPYGYPQYPGPDAPLPQPGPEYNPYYNNPYYNGGSYRSSSPPGY